MTMDMMADVASGVSLLDFIRKVFMTSCKQTSSTHRRELEQSSVYERNTLSLKVPYVKVAAKYASTADRVNKQMEILRCTRS